METGLLTNEPEDEQDAIITPPKPKHGFITVEPVLGAIFLAQVLSDSVLTELFLKRTCEVELALNASVCAALGTNTTEGRLVETLVQPHAASYLMWKTILQSVLPAVLSLFLGPWSEQFGRKPVIVISLAGCGLMYVVYVVLAYIPNLPAGALLLGIVPLTVMGGYVNMISACACFISDITTIEDRSFRLAVMEGFIMAGGLIGLPLTGILFSSAEKIHLGHLANFGLSALLCLIALIYLVFFVNESIELRQTSSGWSRLVDLNFPKEMLRTCFQPRPGHGRLIILFCAYVLASLILVLEGESQIGFLFARLRFGWDLETYTMVSAVLLVIIIIGTVVGGWLLPKFLKIPDVHLALFPLLTEIIDKILKAVAGPKQAYFLFIGGGISALKGVISPAIRSIISKTVPAEDLGKVFAFTFSLESVLPIASGPLYVSVYDATLSVMPGAVYFLTVGIGVINAGLLLAVAVIQKKFQVTG